MPTKEKVDLREQIISLGGERALIVKCVPDLISIFRTKCSECRNFHPGGSVLKTLGILPQGCSLYLDQL